MYLEASLVYNCLSAIIIRVEYFFCVFRDSEAGQPPITLSDDHRFTLPKPPSALLSDTPESRLQLEQLFSGLETLEESLNYKFRDKAYLVQAFTHASYIQNTVTDCYQR